ncbi:MAG: hypothetical protein WBB29_00920 [Geitlerinemataceae cyanobacterium]
MEIIPKHKISKEENSMEPMIWKPEKGDKKRKAYLEQVNQAPYGVIFLIILLAIGGVTALFLIGSL